MIRTTCMIKSIVVSWLKLRDLGQLNFHVTREPSVPQRDPTALREPVEGLVNLHSSKKRRMRKTAFGTEYLPLSAYSGKPLAVADSSSGSASATATATATAITATATATATAAANGIASKRKDKDKDEPTLCKMRNTTSLSLFPVSLPSVSLCVTVV